MSPISHSALMTLANIREAEVAGLSVSESSHDKRFTRVLLRRGFVHYFANDSDADSLATTTEGVNFLINNIDLVCAGLSIAARSKKFKALDIELNTERDTLKAECDALVAERDALKAERDQLIETLAEIAKDVKETDERQVRELSTARTERDYCLSQLLYAHRLAATGAKLDDIEKMRVVFGLITSETKPHDPNPWWSVAALGTLGMMGVVGALGYAAYAKKGGAK